MYIYCKSVYSTSFPGKSPGNEVGIYFTNKQAYTFITVKYTTKTSSFSL